MDNFFIVWLKKLNRVKDVKVISRTFLSFSSPFDSLLLMIQPLIIITQACSAMAWSCVFFKIDIWPNVGGFKILIQTSFSHAL